MTLTLSLPSEVEERLLRIAERRSLPVETVAVQILKEHLSPEQRRSQFMALLQSWIDDESQAPPSDAADEFLHALDADRLGERKLYPPELKGVTW